MVVTEIKTNPIMPELDFFTHKLWVWVSGERVMLLGSCLLGWSLEFQMAII